MPRRLENHTYDLPYHSFGALTLRVTSGKATDGPVWATDRVSRELRSTDRHLCRDRRQLVERVCSRHKGNTWLYTERRIRHSSLSRYDPPHRRILQANGLRAGPASDAHAEKSHTCNAVCVSARGQMPRHPPSERLRRAPTHLHTSCSVRMAGTMCTPTSIALVICCIGTFVARYRCSRDLMFKRYVAGSETLFSSSFPLEKVQCNWEGVTLRVIAQKQFYKIRNPRRQGNARRAERTRNSVFSEANRSFSSVPAGLAITVATSRDSMLFLGRKNAVTVTVRNPGKTTVTGSASISLAPDWAERVQSQLTWWGGIVNLLAINKGPVERKTFPAQARSRRFVDRRRFFRRQIHPPGGWRFSILRFQFPIMPPLWCTLLRSLSAAMQPERRFVVVPPVTAHLMIPNGRKPALLIDYTNHTPDRITVSSALFPDAAWKTTGRIRQDVTFAPFESRSISIPLQLSRYTEDNQRYPITLTMAANDFRTTLVRDFYVGIAHSASQPPSLDGSWKNWNRTNPMLITKSSQIGRLLFGNQPWRGEQDLSARIFTMYDKTYLYVGADVTDDSVVAHWDFPRMSYPLDTDAMEVVFDTRVNSAQGTDPRTPGLFRHLSLAEYRITDFGADAWQRGRGGGGHSCQNQTLCRAPRRTHASGAMGIP